MALEVVAAMAFRTLALALSVGPVDDALLARHFGRKHGSDAYDGEDGRGGS